KLITVRGLEVLTQAGVVVYDHLVSTRLLEHVRPKAVLIYAGKEKGRHTKSQDAINRLLVRSAKAGKTVVRLKGGDPVLFGRAGEEALALAKHRIPFEIVPGVTSAIAAPAYAGIPVTHRALSSSVAIITGHEDPSKPGSSINWKPLATATETLVCLMGVGRLGQIAGQLTRHGRSKMTPCAVIEWGTLPTQRTVTGTLGTIAKACARAKVAPPAILVVGEVVRLRRRLNWFERKPLFGRRIVVTRPTDRAREFAGLLESLGAEVIALPAIELGPVQANGAFHQALGRIEQFDWVFFTSPEGIHWFRRMLRPERKDLRVLHGRRIGAIGPKTAASIQELGLHVDFVPATFSQEGMLGGLSRRRLAGKRALILSAEESRDVLEQGLKARGMDVVRVPIYRTLVPAALTKHVKQAFARPGDRYWRAGADRVDWVTVTSSSCVEHVAQALASSGLSSRMRTLRFASIGPVTSAAVRKHGGRVAVEARRATIEALVEALVKP
ncbi:MAG: uroporphyrinogen-III C-methyltransferase, partial [Candidatus Omnitrophica bacterium]|nr:uroporphyrinogen-III C-methyltransferase [Candidatus Omnitrophota bacterium]